MFCNQYRNSSHPFPFSIEGEVAGACSSKSTFSLKIDKLFTVQETITNIAMKFISRGLSIKDFALYGEEGGGNQKGTKMDRVKHAKF